MKNYSNSGDTVINSFLKSRSNLLTKKVLQVPPTTYEFQTHGENLVTESKRICLKMQSIHHEQLTSLHVTLMIPFNLMIT